MTFDPESRAVRIVMAWVQGYNHNKYWSRRGKVVDSRYKNIVLKMYYLFYIKRIDGKFNCSFGTNYNDGATFKTPPKLPHGPKGIIVGHDVLVGEHLTIFQHATLTRGASIIGDNVMIGAGAVVLPGRDIGGNAKIGANVVVVENVPNNATVVPQKPRVILR